MIRVTVELISANGPERNRVLGVVDLYNDNKPTSDKLMNYNGVVYNKSNLPTVKTPQCPSPGARVLREGRVENYPAAAYNVWRLITRMLLELFPEEKKSGR